MQMVHEYKYFFFLIDMLWTGGNDIVIYTVYTTGSNTTGIVPDTVTGVKCSSE